MPKTKTVYFCRLCGSDKIQGTLPAWFRVNEPELKLVNFGLVDAEAHWLWGYCEGCDHSDDFDAMAKQEEVPDEG